MFDQVMLSVLISFVFT